MAIYKNKIILIQTKISNWSIFNYRLYFETFIWWKIHNLLYTQWQKSVNIFAWFYELRCIFFFASELTWLCPACLSDFLSVLCIACSRHASPVPPMTNYKPLVSSFKLFVLKYSSFMVFANKHFIYLRFMYIRKF